MWAERAVRMINCALPDLTEYDVSSWAVYQTHVHHALLGYELIKEWQLAFPEAARLLDQVGVYLRDHARYSEAEHMLRDGLVMREKLLGYSHPLVVQSINNLATLYWERSEFDESQALYERALALCEQGSVSHLEKVTSLNNLGELYCVQGRYYEAEPLLRRALHIRETSFGSMNTDVAITLENLARLLRATARGEEAQELEKRANSIRSGKKTH
jgi:tetratricopeptide (TPR) repeat protein